MGAGTSDTGKNKDIRASQSNPNYGIADQRNYVPICSPPQYDLTFDSTDSEITELEQEQKPLKRYSSVDSRKAISPVPSPAVLQRLSPVPSPSGLKHPSPVPSPPIILRPSPAPSPQIILRPSPTPSPPQPQHPLRVSSLPVTKHPSPIVHPLPVRHPSPILHPSPIVHPTPVQHPLPIVHPSPVRHPSPIVHPLPVRHPSPIVHPLPVRHPSSILHPSLARHSSISKHKSKSQDLDKTHSVSQGNPEEQVAATEYEEEQTVLPESSGVESNEEELDIIRLDEIPEEAEVETTSDGQTNSITESPVHSYKQSYDTVKEEDRIKYKPKRHRCNVEGICTRPSICRLKRCQRQVSFAKRITECDNTNCSEQFRQSHVPSYREDYDYFSSEDNTHYDGFVSCRLIRSNSLSEEETEKGVMPDYQHYSREQPEKDSNSGSEKKPPGSENMRDCSRPCCPNRTASLKHNNRDCRCHQGPSAPNNRHSSESYVAYRGPFKNPSHSKSVPNQLEERDSYANFQVENNQEPLPPRRSASSRKNKSRTYPAQRFDSRGEQERPHIPLPPPPEEFSEQPLVPSHQRHHSKDARDSREPRPSRAQRNLRDLGDSRESTETQEPTSVEEQEERKDMYTHNANRNYGPKKSYNSREYTRQAIKSYPYEEPGGSTPYSRDTTCSSNCSGYDHCPMHHGCRCQCLCMGDDTRFCSQTQSDDQLSYSTDSSTSECMNLAYQRTGDYPELMDELENTLSYRNRMRVQKTMQRFEMLSRQNKNLEKPIFEDDESMHYNYMDGPTNRHKHDNHGCKCRHCEDKLRRESYNTSSDTLAKRSAYQPTPFPRNSGYVEKVARYMDPNLNNRRENNFRKKMEGRRGMPATMTNSNGTWQMDARKNEWVKVDPNNQSQYDFENSYPPLPPRPISERMYDRRNYGPERVPCSCSKCLRRR